MRSFRNTLVILLRLLQPALLMLAHQSREAREAEAEKAWPEARETYLA